jgi:negative regulator of flagellin synthesis FlgM
VSPQNGRLEPQERNGQAGDRVELSAHARLLDRLLQLPDVRIELVEAVRQAIADGTYETPEKLEVAVARLLEEELA